MPNRFYTRSHNMPRPYFLMNMEGLVQNYLDIWLPLSCMDTWILKKCVPSMIGHNVTTNHKAHDAFLSDSHSDLPIAIGSASFVIVVDPAFINALRSTVRTHKDRNRQQNF
jgi:hypothetical protein